MNENKKTAVMYGAGNIGRGFIGQLFHDSGFEVVFIDVNSDVVDALNERKSYTQITVDGSKTEEREIQGVRAINGSDHSTVAREIADCEIMAVSVGSGAFTKIIPIIAEGLAMRKRSLNILVCENIYRAPQILKRTLESFFPDNGMPERIGCVGTTIGRMVPVVPISVREKDPTVIYVEKFCVLPIDNDAVVLPFPNLEHSILCSPFKFEEEKKLFIHNMGHATAAYLGYCKNYEYIWQAMKNATIRGHVKEAMTATSEALAKKYNKSIDDLLEYTDDLILRFGNKGLGDTVARVGGDPMRKLGRSERFSGAVRLCRTQGVDCSPLFKGIAAAMYFDVPADPSAQKMHDLINKVGKKFFISAHCGMQSTAKMIFPDWDTYLNL